MPMQVEDMAACKAWFTAKKREENEQAWKIDFKTLLDQAIAAANERKIQTTEQAAGDALYWPLFNLDHKNPTSPDALEHRPPGELVASIIKKEREILRLMEEIQTEVEALA